MSEIQIVFILMFQVSELQLSYNYLQKKPKKVSITLYTKFQVIFGEGFIKVTVEQGALQGEEKFSSLGCQYFSFKGIPYALPPLGILRFQAPQPPSKWEGVRDAMEHGPICIQRTQKGKSDFVVGNEDCLYLNIYTPEVAPLERMPVMFFIHGGGFVFGSGNDDYYAPDFLMGYGIVLVTINYRLDALGFLSLDIIDASGNAGLKDQVAALQWVNRNIQNFGGDPDQITIFGQSAGGDSVDYLLVTPVAKGLFHRAISMSGSLYNDYDIASNHLARARILARALGIYSSDPQGIIDELRRLPAEQLVSTRPYVLLSDSRGNNPITTSFFSPIVEKELGGYHYLTEQPLELARKGVFNDVDLMMGHTELEGLNFAYVEQDGILKYYPQYKELYVPVQISYIENIPEVLEIGDKIEEYYFGNGTVTLNTIGDFALFYSYALFVFDIHFFLDNIVPRNTTKKHYFYEFAIFSSRNFYSLPAFQRFGIAKATHRDDIPYLFDGYENNASFYIDDEARTYIDKMCSLFTNFATYGTPTPDDSFGILWPDYEDNMEYVRIADKLTINQVQYTNNLAFWRDIYQNANVTPYIAEN